MLVFWNSWLPEAAEFGPQIVAAGKAANAAGVKCVVFESELFPRPHVGESLVPSSTRVFRDLDFLETMERERFPHKFGAGRTAANSQISYEHDWDGLGAEEGHAHVDGPNIRFVERQQPGVEQDYTYHAKSPTGEDYRKAREEILCG